MSNVFATLDEQDAYDQGFASGKDYWTPLAEANIIELINALVTTDVVPFEVAKIIINRIEES